MKKLLLCMALAALCCGIAVAQTGASYYVSARGNDNNDGLSEDAPLQSLIIALASAQTGTIKKITVIGTLNETSEYRSSTVKERFGTIFFLSDMSEGKNTAEILITGKPGASGSERAVLSAKGSQAGVVSIGNNAKLRFEHIEISGGEKKSDSDIGAGISMFQAANSTITLGPGTVVRDNQGNGIWMGLGAFSCILDGGEIRENLSGGVIVGGGPTFTMRNGVIRDNKSPNGGGGVVVVANGRFTMSGGTITGNSAGMEGGGVFVGNDGRFNQTGGAITGNTAKQGSDPNVFREQASTPSSSSTSRPATTPSAPPSAPSAPRPATTPPKQKNSIEFAGSFGLDVRALYPGLFSLGVPLQLGAEFNFSSMALALLGEAAVGMAFPNFADDNPNLFWELSLGAMGEFYFPGKKFGIGAGGGFFSAAPADLITSDTATPANDPISTSYARFALIFKGSSKISLYAQLYGTGGFGFGLQWGVPW